MGMENNKAPKKEEKKAVWSEALLDSFGGDVRETHAPGDIIQDDINEGSGIRYHATNGSWSGNIAKIRF